MRRNRTIENANGLFSGRRRRAGGRVLCILGAAAAACMLILLGIIVNSETRTPFAPEQVRLNGSYQAEMDGFTMSFQVERNGGAKAEDGDGAVPEPAGTVHARSALPGGTAARAVRLSDPESELETTQESETTQEPPRLSFTRRM